MLPLQEKSRKSGLTLVEVIVSISVIAILTALLLTGVLAIRESARKAQCANHLRQLGLALQNYHSIHNALPAGNNGRGVSLHAMLLPLIDQQVLYNNLNFSTPFPPFLSEANDTAKSTRISLFLCPSDSFDTLRTYPNNSYMGNQGVFSNYGIHSKPQDGVFTSKGGPVSDAMIQDGLSNTVAMWEWSQKPRVAKIALPSDSFNADELRVACVDAAAASFTIDKESNWLNGNFNNTLYNHVVEINGNSCVPNTRFAAGAWTAGSRHGRGCQSLYVDGHVNFMSSTINIKLWRSLATRSSGEIVPSL